MKIRIAGHLQPISRLISRSSEEFKCKFARRSLRTSSIKFFVDATRTAPRVEKLASPSRISDVNRKVRQDPLIGAVVQKKYQILDLLGVGGMAKVYKAQHLHTRKLHAFKILREHLSSNNTVVRRFQNEARAASRVEHPNCVTVSDFGSWEQEDQPNSYFLVMEYAPGPNLHSIIDEYKSSKMQIV